MSCRLKRSLIALSVSSVLITPSVFATNGYFAHGYGTAEKGLAGAGVAHSSDSLASATNPALMVRVGNRFDVGAALFSPDRSYTTTNPQSTSPQSPGINPMVDPSGFPLSPGTFESEHTLFLIPNIGYNSMINATSSWGVAAYGNGGLNTDYEGVSNGPGAPLGTFGSGAAGVDLAQLIINFSYSKLISKKHSIGVSALIGYQKFKADGLAGLSAFSSDPSSLTNSGDDSAAGFGLKFGWVGEVSKALTLGASYQTEIKMGEFDDYAGLFAENGDFDVPATGTIGLAWKTSKSSTLVLDVQEIYYSDVAAIGNGIAPLSNGSCQPSQMSGTGGTGNGCLGGSAGAGFGWDDMTIVKLGYEWGNNITWRVGVSSGSNPIPESQVLFNILAPAVVETHITAGFTMPLSTDSEFSLSLLYVPSNTVTGPSPFDVNRSPATGMPTQVAADAQTITLDLEEYEIQASYTLKF